MNRIWKILEVVLIIVVGIIIIRYLYTELIYKSELYTIKEELNEIKNVEVIDIWGHNDLQLEEISARINIKNKGELVLYGLSSDSYSYPLSVPICEIGGYSFTSFSCSGGVGSSLNIGTLSTGKYLFNREFNSVREVINSYDLILNTLDTLKKSPEINHFLNEQHESFLLIKEEKSKDTDPIYDLYGMENKFEYGRSLNWTHDCTQNW